jgi:signal peptidase I
MMSEESNFVHAGAPDSGRYSRNPWLAVALSVLLVGLGHLYAGQPRRGLCWYAILLLTAGVAAVSLLTFPLGPFTLPLVAVGGVGVNLLAAVGAWKTAARAPADYQLRPYNQVWVYVAAVVGLALAHAGIRALVIVNLVEAFKIPSGAMEPTLLVGDYLYASKIIDPARIRPGAVVVFEWPLDPTVMVIKRVAGVAGDTLAMSDNVLYRNARAVMEPYAVSRDPLNDPTDPRMRSWQQRYFVGGDPDSYGPSLKNWGPIEVPLGFVFVLGDNRDNSFDSRYFGLVSTEAVKGRPMRIYYSYDKHGLFPLQRITAIRWRRLGKRVE